ncbi:hypothetical protein KKF61_06565 [Patescibacteria group bacterium]|nr:hypothetical protein [Patescibacteria group bacterium]MBU0964359.1 hypothetical protein [Patescibacteria group bacterium]
MPPKKLIVSITGYSKADWRKKLQEAKQYRLKEIGLFIESFSVRQRQGLLDALKNSCVKKIPLVHIRDDITKQEIAFLKKHFQTKYFTIHEPHFHILDKWRGYYKDLYLELNTDDRMKKYVSVKKIGGFCTDLAHFNVEVVKQSKEYRYTVDHLGKTKVGCNHLSGYSPVRNTDLHTISSVKDFDYLASLPHAVFGRVIAFEIYNSIREQLNYLPHIKKLLQDKLNFEIT